MQQVPSLESDSLSYVHSQVGNEDNSSFKDSLTSIMVNQKQGKVVEYKETDSQEKLNGTYVIKTYQIRFFGGKVSNVEFKFLKPTMNGEFHVVDANFID